MATSQLNSSSSFNRRLSQKPLSVKTLAEVKQQLTAAVNEKADIVKVVRSLLKGVQEEKDKDIRKEIFLFSFKQLNSGILINSKAKELVGLLLPEVDKLQGSTLIELADCFTDGVKTGAMSNGRSLEMFPRILVCILNEPVIVSHRDDENVPNKMNGQDWKRHLLNSFFSCKWSQSCVLHIVNISRDIPLEEDESKFLIEKLFRVMKSLPVQELPPLVYQLLLLAAKGHHSLILTGIKDLFDQLEQEGAESQNKETDNDDVMEVGTNHKELLHSKGTVLLHMDLALKQNQELLKVFLKSLKVSTAVFHPSNYTPFTLSLALSLSLINRLESTIMDNLRAVIIRCFKEKRMIFNSHWMLELSEHRPLPDIEAMFLHIVDNSVYGWDKVMSGLINLAFSLLDSYSPKTSSTIFELTPNNKACYLGGKILTTAFKSQSMVRSEVLTQLTNRILSNSAAYVDHYISILAEVLRSSPQVLMDIGPQLKEAFGYVMFIPSSSAISLIKAILPLIQFRSSYRDSLLLALRKALFNREVECRCAAAGSYLLLLKNFKVLDSISADESSQFVYSSQSQQTLAEVHLSSSETRSMSSNESLCLEILSLLRRSLTQQDAVRLLLYKEMPSVLSANTKLAEPVLDFLLNQFNKYYQTDGDLLPPLKLAPCMKTNCDGLFVRSEPLSHLVCCIQLCTKQCMEWVENGAEPMECLDKLKGVLVSLTRRFSTCELEDFELDKSGDYLMGTSVGSKNHIAAAIVMETYETLLDYTFSTGSINQEVCELSLKLYSKYQVLHDVLTERGGANKRGTVRTVLLSQPTLLLILKSLFKDTLPAHQVPLSVLRESSQFVHYILHVTLLKIKESPDEATPWNWGSTQESRASQTNYRFLCSVAKILHSQLDGATLQNSGGKKDKSRSIASLCLEAFVETVRVVTACYHQDLIPFVTEFTGGGESRDGQEEPDPNEKLHVVICHFQRLVSSILSRSCREYTIKDVHFMVSLIVALTDNLDTSSSQCYQVLDWLESICREHNIDDLTLSKSLISFLLSLNYRAKGTVKIFRKLAQDIHFHQGDIDEEIELSGTTCYAIVNPRTAAGPVLSELQSHIEVILQGSEAVLNLVKLETEDVSNVSLSEESVKDLYSGLCDRFVRIVLTFHELVQTTLPPGAATDTLVKNLAKLYNVLSEITKQQTTLYLKSSVLLSQFIKVVENVGKNLSAQVYEFLLYLQRTQLSMIEQGQSKKGKGKSKLVGKAQVKREKKNVPNLIYWMEQFENLIIKLSKKSKYKLTETFKRSVARDFRIQDEKLEVLLNEQDDIEEGEEGDEGKQEMEEDDESVQSSPKRFKEGND